MAKTHTPKQIEIIWLTIIDNIPDALPPEQENLVAAIWSAILRWRGVSVNDILTKTF